MRRESNPQQNLVKSAESDAIVPAGGAKSGALGQELETIVNRWDLLAPAVRRAILVLVSGDEAWVFQPKVRVLDAAVPPQPIFVQRRDWKHDLTRMDPISREETESLEMLYRYRLEFAVGHGISVHATLPEPEAIQAQMLETEFVPCSEVEQQTPPTPVDDGNLAGVVLDMKELTQMSTPALIASLRQMQSAYGDWIQRETAKKGDPAERLGDLLLEILDHFLLLPVHPAGKGHEQNVPRVVDHGGDLNMGEARRESHTLDGRTGADQASLLRQARMPQLQSQNCGAVHA